MSTESQAVTGVPSPFELRVRDHQVSARSRSIDHGSVAPSPRGSSRRSSVNGTNDVIDDEIDVIESTKIPTSMHAVDGLIASDETRIWRLPTTRGAGFDVIAHADRLDTLTFNGKLIGFNSALRARHVCDFPRGYASQQLRCGACRWFETRIFRLATDDSDFLHGARYLLHHVGRSIVPGEVDIPRHEVTRSAYEVIESYIVRKQNITPFIAKPGANALAQAATYDEDIEDAYINRATA